MVFEVDLLLVGFVTTRDGASERSMGASHRFILLLTWFDMSRDHVITSSEIRITNSNVWHQASALNTGQRRSSVTHWCLVWLSGCGSGDLELGESLLTSNL